MRHTLASSTLRDHLLLLLWQFWDSFLQTIFTSDFSLCLPPQQELVLPGGLMQLLKYAYMAATALPYFINSLWIHTNIKHYSNIIHREWCAAGMQGGRPTRLVPLQPLRLKNLLIFQQLHSNSICCIYFLFAYRWFSYWQFIHWACKTISEELSSQNFTGNNFLLSLLEWTLSSSPLPSQMWKHFQPR